MSNTYFEITPEYRFKSYLKYTLFSTGVVLIIIQLIINTVEVLSFLGLVVIIAGLLFTLFTSKQYLKINRDQIEFESKSIIKEFSKSQTIRFVDIEKVYFLKKQFLIFGGRNPVADASAQTLYNANRIVFLLKDKRSTTIVQTGKLKDFKRAFEIIKERIETLTPPYT